MLPDESDDAAKAPRSPMTGPLPPIKIGAPERTTKSVATPSFPIRHPSNGLRSAL